MYRRMQSIAITVDLSRHMKFVWEMQLWQRRILTRIVVVHVRFLAMIAWRESIVWLAPELIATVGGILAIYCTEDVE